MVRKNPLVLLKKEDTLLCIFSHAPVGEGSCCTCTLICSPTPLGFGQPSGCFSILPVLYYSPQPWALQTQPSLLDVGSGLSLGCGHTHQVQSPPSVEGYFPTTLRPTPGLCSLLSCFIYFFFKEKSFPLMQENLIMQ